uniref:Reverse transcriptase domain-containing protein n=1 Tax=Cannabis sativa TaxID=3483 RepID=A0A803NMC7_CANSA
MDPAAVTNMFQDAVQISHDDIAFALNPSEVDEPEEANQVLLGKIISRYKLGKVAIQGSLKLSWNAIKGWKWKELDDNIIQFTFANRNDALNVLARHPWFVCGALIVIMPWPSWLSPSEVRFDKTPIWGNINSIPPFYWNLSNLKEFASKASPVYELPSGIEDVVGMSSLRFRATIDLNKPLFSGFFLRRQRLKDLWLQYKYEKLPKMCFKCGVLTHDQSLCFKPPTVIKDEQGNLYPMYGVWLKKDANEKSTFSTSLAKWFQDWTLQKRLINDPTLRNQIKVQKALKNGDSDELRECRRQLPSKKRIVSDDEAEKDGMVITQLPMVYLPEATLNGTLGGRPALEAQERSIETEAEHPILEGADGDEENHGLEPSHFEKRKLNSSEGVNCKIQFASRFLIIGEISSDPPGCHWKFFGTYGPPHSSDKEEFWTHTGELALGAGTPILLCGDMNGTLKDSECFNYVRRSNSSRYAFDFRRMVQRVGLVDLGHLGPGFTWIKDGNCSYLGRTTKRARLDHGLASPDWRILFPNAVITHLSATGSDHRPLLLDTTAGVNCKRRSFKYENMWMRDPRCVWVVKEAWASQRHHNPMVSFNRKLKATRDKLKSWNKIQFQEVKKQVHAANDLLQKVEMEDPFNGSTIEQAKFQLNEALLREEIHWKQKSRVQWLQEGDKCSKFFMASTIVRHRRNYIQCIKDTLDGEWIRDQQQIANCFLKKFSDGFRNQRDGSASIPSDLFQNVISTEEGNILCSIPSESEMEEALSEMGKDKAPGPDGFPPSFYNHHWNTVHSDLFQVISHFFNHNDLPRYIKDTSIVLIPKKDSPSLVTDYRPIALCNTTYKEIVHSMKKRKGKGGYMLIKIDLENAYDRMGWEFVIKVLVKVLLNGSIAGKFTPDQGLRQGDPLSPSLFILADETLSRLLFSKEKAGLLKGFKLSRRGSAITHLMFADDIILFGQATIKEARSFLDCLNTYCNWSGQEVNEAKSSIFFSKGVSSRKAQAISQLLGMKKMNSKATYLGLPLFRSLKRTEDTNHLVERVLKGVQGWKARLLSSAGKTCLVKSVGSTLSNYCGDVDDKRTLHTVSWGKLCTPKVAGGLGFRSTLATNKAFLLKWAWKILMDENSLWGQLMKNKYFPNQSFLDLEIKNSDSLMWKAILRGRPLLMEGLCRRIGDGRTTSIWFDPWVPGGRLQPIPRVDATGGISLVKPSGEFSIKSAYRLSLNIDTNRPEYTKWKTVWGVRIHNRLKMIWWKILSNSLLTKARLSMVFALDNALCPLCNMDEENSLHLLWSCEFTRAIWFGCMWQVRTNALTAASWEDWLVWFSDEDKRPNRMHLHLFLGGTATVFEEIWRVRNKLTHDNTHEPLPVLIHRINQRLMELTSVHDGYCSAQLNWEVYALVKGAEMASELGFNKVIFQSDSINAINAIQCNQSSLRTNHHNIQSLLLKFDKASCRQIDKSRFCQIDKAKCRSQLVGGSLDPKKLKWCGP